MKDLFAVLLALAGVPALANIPPPPSVELERTHDFATLSWGEAPYLHGQRTKFRIVLDSAPDSEAGRVLYDCVGKDGVDRSVWLVGEQEIEDEMVVEATLRIVHFEPWVAPDGMRFAGFTEYRLEDARRCR